MDSRLPKLCPGILVSSVAVFILLSAPTFAEDATRCYWCGPLADQVHRSQRAPSCDIFDHNQHHTVCDKGYTHCAIVATSPPYAESRLCVKFYQDECYSLYCNSTKTWRMVCACRGDLCNGRPTDRETKAFAAVPRKLGTTRTKRAFISGFNSVKTKTPADNTIIIINETNNDTINYLQSDQPAETNSSSTMDDMPKQIEDNIIIEHGTVKNIESSITHAYVNKGESSDENKMHSNPPIIAITSTENQLDDAKMAQTTPVLEYTTPAEFVKETSGSDVSDATSIKPSVEVEVAEVHNSVPPLGLPPAEALQQNVTPTKAIELTTVVVTATEDIQLIQTTTFPSKISNVSKENIGAQNVAPIIVFLIIFFIHYCL